MKQILPRRGGDLRSRKILPGLYFCDGQVKLSVKQTERMSKEMEIEPRRKRKHFTADERVRIEALRKAGHTHQYIAEQIGCCRSAITRELKKGMVEHLDYRTYIVSTRYDAYAAQQAAEYQKTAHSKGLKLGNNHAYAKAIGEWICKGFSPYAAIHKVKNDHGITISKQTLYRYIKEGLIPNVTYKNLPVGKQKKRKGKVTPMRSSSLHRSIEQRPKYIVLRDTFGHWEIDSIIGSNEGKKESCLVLTERMTRQEIVIKVADKTTLSTVKAMQSLKRKLGSDFKKIFKTLTADNGCEFADQAGLDALGLTTYYCHPQAPHERGGNENNNKLLRRYFPKGKSMKNKTQQDATKAQYFINDYPREMFGGRCSNDLFKEQLEKINLRNGKKVYQFFGIC